MIFNHKKIIIIFGKGPATKNALISAEQILNKNFELYYFYFERENYEFDNLSTCRNLKIKEFKINSYEEFEQEVFSLSPIFIVLTQCSLIIKKDLINFMGGNIINLHHGNLPKYRGMGPITNAILEGEKYFGITIHIVEEKIDTGRILYQKNFNISGLTNEEVYNLCIISGKKLLINLFEKINLSNELISFKQDENDATYFSGKALNYKKPIINFEQNAEKIMCFCRAYYFPSKNLFPLIQINSKLYYSKYLPEIGLITKDKNIIKLNEKEKILEIACKDKLLIFREIQIKN